MASSPSRAVTTAKPAAPSIVSRAFRTTGLSSAMRIFRSGNLSESGGVGGANGCSRRSDMSKGRGGAPVGLAWLTRAIYLNIQAGDGPGASPGPNLFAPPSYNDWNTNRRQNGIEEGSDCGRPRRPGRAGRRRGGQRHPGQQQQGPGAGAEGRAARPHLPGQRFRRGQAQALREHRRQRLRPHRAARREGGRPGAEGPDAGPHRVRALRGGGAAVRSRGAWARSPSSTGRSPTSRSRAWPSSAPTRCTRRSWSPTRATTRPRPTSR